MLIHQLVAERPLLVVPVPTIMAILQGIQDHLVMEVMVVVILVELVVEVVGTAAAAVSGQVVEEEVVILIHQLQM